MPWPPPESAPRLVQGALVVCVALLAGVSWTYTLLMPDMDRTVAEMAAAAGAWRPWSGIEAIFTLVMWVVMMVAMMVPSALPMLLVFERLQRSRQTGFAAFKLNCAFLLGYFVVWTGFSVLATMAQAALHGFGLLAMGMHSVSPVFSGLLLIAAGAYQLSPLKSACLAKCRSPLAFLLSEWREGVTGALVMGLRHGAYCVGCCWLLMALLFVGGVMNVLWIAGLSAIVLLEKTLPTARLAPVLGTGLMVWGAWLLVAV